LDKLVICLKKRSLFILIIVQNPKPILHEYNAELVINKVGGTCSYHDALKGYVAD